MESPEPKKINGGCHCGNVRYHAITPTIRITHCHCDMCRAFGGTFMSWISISTNDFSMSNSTVRNYRSSASAHREFCSNCGSHLTFRHADSPGVVDISIGTLDNPEQFAPDNQIWGDDKLTFLNGMNGLAIVSGNKD